MDTQDILFQYLKDIIYNTENASLDLNELPPEFQKLGQGMQLLGKWVKEAKVLSFALARGDLSCGGVDKENIFAAPLKEQQSMLRHLAWQTQQVAKGDYSQTVDFMGEFSDAFNTMTKQLEERREALFAEKQRVEEKNKELERTYELAMVLSEYTHNVIFIYSAENQEELYKNEFAECFLESRPKVGELMLEKLALKSREGMENSCVWQFETISDGGREEYDYFNVESYPITWKEQKAFVHIIVDDTERKRKENRMYRLAYADVLTGLYNRRYAMELMNRWMGENIPFVLSFIDVDYLKYYNDTMGHKAGDIYLLETAKILSTLGGVLCRTGGDEFMLIQKGKTPAEQNQKLEHARQMMHNTAQGKCPKSFSYASCEVRADGTSLDEYIFKVDALMYKYKEKYKQPLEDAAYKDDRKLN